MMSSLFDDISHFIGEPPSLLFGALLVPHVLAGMTCVVSGAVAMLTKKRRGRHPRFGDIYYWGLLIVFTTASGMSVLRWSEDSYLFVLGALSFGSASIGYLARRRHWRGWTTIHIVGMGVSYVVLLTAFYVDNGPRLPLYDRLPMIVFWTVPTLIGLPLVARALARHTRVLEDLRAFWHTLEGRSTRRVPDPSASPLEKAPAVYPSTALALSRHVATRSLHKGNQGLDAGDEGKHLENAANVAPELKAIKRREPMSQGPQSTWA